MKQKRKWILLTLAAFMIMAVPAMAAGGNGQCAMSGNQTNSQFAYGPPDRPCRIITNGEPVTITGTVYEAPYAGQGLTVDTGVDLVTVYGIGPQWYWDQLGISRPDVGEEVEISAVQVTFSDGTQKIIALSITIGGDVVVLRDDNGRPLWRSKGPLT
jgi:hypothetical protein